jgi:predicted DNA-binding ribbon-helix-helix protein
MVLQISQVPPGPIDVLPGWRHHGALHGDDDHLAAIRAAAAAATASALDSPVDRLAEIPRFSSSDVALDVLLLAEATRSSPPAHAPMPAPSSSLIGNNANISRLNATMVPSKLTAMATTNNHGANAQQAMRTGFSFSPKGSAARSKATSLDFPPFSPCVAPKGIKRPRHGLDVDGPNTASMSSKKRRLRGQLTTSRLSQPFSQPATHILNREGLKSGDKRFYKIATSIDEARRRSHLHATSFLRFAMMNRLRKRMGLVGRPPFLARQGSSMEEDEDDYDEDDYDDGQHDNDEDEGVRVVPKPLWQQASVQTVASLRCPQPPGSEMSRHPGPHERALPIMTTKAVTVNAPIVAKHPSCRLSKPAALPRPSSDAAAVKDRTSPRIHPVQSPELRPLCASLYDDLDEDSFAFMHPEDDEGSDNVTDDPEHVYSDFSVIFGGGGSGGGTHAAAPSSSSSEDHSYEEYLDELDGISWVSG